MTDMEERLWDMERSIVLEEACKTQSWWVDDNKTPNLLMTGLSERACEPLQTFVETISGCSASGLNVLQIC
jgi:hypothetical protein